MLPIFILMKESLLPHKNRLHNIYRIRPSPSFRREILLNTEDIKYVIEYAIYWDFDIQHLFELEHVWVYVDHTDRIADCEASFHGKYIKGLLKDRSNLEVIPCKVILSTGKTCLFSDCTAV